MFKIVIDRFSWKTVVVALFVPLLRTLTIRNYRLRQAGLLPDKWYWADIVLCWGGLLMTEKKYLFDTRKDRAESTV